MDNNTLYLPGFHLQTLRKTPRTARQKLLGEYHRIRQHSLSQPGECFSKFIPAHLVRQGNTKAFSRSRVFSKENTFWAFFSQVLDSDSGCQEAIRKIPALATSKGLPLPSSSTSGYCQVRQKLDSETLESIPSAATTHLEQQTSKDRWHGHRVVVVDGTGLTPKNQVEWPQQSNLTPGCGFPQARLCGLFSLHSGALLSYRSGNKNQ